VVSWHCHALDQYVQIKIDQKSHPFSCHFQVQQISRIEELQWKRQPREQKSNPLTFCGTSQFCGERLWGLGKKEICGG
jgi:hypothetical protein